MSFDILYSSSDFVEHSYNVNNVSGLLGFRACAGCRLMLTKEQYSKYQYYKASPLCGCLVLQLCVHFKAAVFLESQNLSVPKKFTPSLT